MTVTRRVAWGGSRQRRLRFYFQDPAPWSDVVRVDVSRQDSISKGQGFPDWKARIKRGESATTIMAGESHSQKALEDGYVYLRRNSSDFFIDDDGVRSPQWVEYEYRGTLGLDSTYPDDPGSIFISSVKNKVIQAIVRQIREAQTSLRGEVLIGETAENLRMIRSRARTIYGGAHKYLDTVKNLGRNLRRRSLYEFTRSVEDLYLETVFGWLPSVSDIQDGAKALSRIVTYREPRKSVRFAAESSELVSSDLTTETFGPLMLKIRRSLTATYGCRIYGSVSVSNQIGAVPVLDELGLNFNEFLPTIWELLPYSFLADYFSNIGAIVDAYSLNSIGVSWLNIGERKRYRLNSVCDEVQIQPPPTGHSDVDKQINLGSPYYHFRERIFRDSYLIGDLTPTLELKIPGLGMKWLNIAALVGAGSRVTDLLGSRLDRD